MPDFDDDAHPRDERGKFTSGGGGGLSKWAEHRAGRLAAPLLNLAEKQGGFSVRPGVPRPERTPTDGYMVSRATSEGLNHKVDIAAMHDRNPPPTEADVHAEVERGVREWLHKALPAVGSMKDHYLGGWFERSKATGRITALHLDVSEHIRDRSHAIAQGIKRDQKAVYDVVKGEEIDTGGTGL